MFRSKQDKILARILEIRKTQEQRKPNKAVVKKITKVSRKSKVETTSEKKTALMLKILDDKKLKAGEKLEKVFSMLNGK